MRWPLLDALPDDDVRRVLDMARKRTFAKGEVVFHQGDPADTLHLIRSGRFAVRATTEHAQTAILSVLGPGEAFGELALLSPGEPRSATVAALEGAQTLSVHQLDFGRVRREHPQVADVLIAVLSAQVRRLSGHLLEALYTPVETRVRRRLLDLVALYREDEPGAETVVPLTQDELADLAGTSRATVNRVLREDEERGSVRLGRGRTVVLDEGSLARLAGVAVPGRA